MRRVHLSTPAIAVALTVALAGSAVALPDGPGKEQVQTSCSSCHSTGLIMGSSGYDREGWDALTATMIDLEGAPETRDSIVDYLAANFPPNDERTPTIVPGEADISFTEWVVPSLGQRPRDPVEAADGSIWWAGQWGNMIGRIDPKTGGMKEYPLPAGAHPHTVLTDEKGRIWYTGNKNGTMGVLNPETGEITEYKMPDENARDPHSAIFDDDGVLWFTLQHSNMVGRLDPETGDIKLVSARDVSLRIRV